MKKKALLLVMLVAALQFVPGRSYAAEVKDASTCSNSSGIEAQSQDEIVTKFRYYNGRLQYRRWNATKACWVDAGWIEMP